MSKNCQIIISVPGHSLDFQLDMQSLYTLNLFSAKKHRHSQRHPLWRMQAHVVNPLASQHEYPHNSPVTLEKHKPSPINSGSKAARVHWGKCKDYVSTHMCWLHLQPWPLPTKYMTFQSPRVFFFSQGSAHHIPPPAANLAGFHVSSITLLSNKAQRVQTWSPGASLSVCALPSPESC